MQNQPFTQRQWSRFSWALRTTRSRRNQIPGQQVFFKKIWKIGSIFTNKKTHEWNARQLGVLPTWGFANWSLEIHQQNWSSSATQKAPLVSSPSHNSGPKFWAKPTLESFCPFFQPPFFWGGSINLPNSWMVKKKKHGQSINGWDLRVALWLRKPPF